MDARAGGTFVIAWDQTEIDGVPGAPPSELVAGAVWRWDGRALRLDGPQGCLALTGALGEDALRSRAARKVARLLGRGAGGRGGRDGAIIDDPGPPPPACTVTDGLRAFDLRLVSRPGRGPLLAVDGALPPPRTDLWVVRRPPGRAPGGPAQAAGTAVICFTAGTRIDTPRGTRPVEQLRPGDRVLTCDDGAQPVLWTGRRRLSSAQLRAQPGLRPLRIRSGALGPGRPDGDLALSPRHRLLLRGRAPQALFGTPEVLVAAADLAGDLAVQTDHSLRPVTYVHLMFSRHQILRANGVECESFHPEAVVPEALDPEGRAALAAGFPALLADPGRYGPTARRALSPGEAAILLHDLGPPRGIGLHH